MERKGATRREGQLVRDTIYPREGEIVRVAQPGSSPDVLVPVEEIQIEAEL